VAGKEAGAHDDFASAQKAMCGVKDKVFKPIPENHAIYKKLFKLYMQLHDGFGIPGAVDMYNVMKDLLTIKEEVK
jgi:L-ribulokinase